jgi:ATP-binding cassette subfamily B multidrug efflux pump
MSASGIAGSSGPAAPRGELGEEIFSTFDPRIVQRFWGFVRPYPRELRRVALAVTIFVASQVSIPIVIRYAADSAVARHKAFPLDIVVIGFFALILANAVTSFLQEWTAATLAQRVIFDLRRAMFAHLQQVSSAFIEQTHVGRIMSRIQGDVNSLQEFLETSIQAVGDFVLINGIIIVLLFMDWRLGLLALGAVPALVVVRALWLPRAKETFRRARDASSVANAALAENINGVRTVQQSRRESVNFAAYDKKAWANFQAQVRSAWTAQIMVPTVDILTGLGQAAVVIAGGAAVFSGRLGIGVMIAFIFYVQRFFDPIRSLSQQYTVMQRAMAAGYRIFEVLDVPVRIHDKPDAVVLDAAEPSIEFRNVTFGYHAGQPVLHDVTFTAHARQVVALVGPTGSGKTSIAALIHRFHDVWEGSVRVAGHDVRDVTLDSLGRTIAMVLQEPFLFTGTVLENIRYSSAWASREDVVNAAKAVHAHDFIIALPDGYDTQLDQRGQNLSIGQRQLLSFARALVADPKILMLDEATASIDSFTERKIQQALKVLLQGRTCIVIAHRLATIRDADVIIVLRQGRIVEQGAHDELLSLKGLYAHLYSRNYASFDDLAVANGNED